MSSIRVVCDAFVFRNSTHGMCELKTLPPPGPRPVQECRVVTSCGDHHVRLWDGKTGTLLQLLSRLETQLGGLGGPTVCANAADLLHWLWLSLPQGPPC